MNVSVNWIKKYIQPSLPIEELAEKLTRIGTPVETIEYPDNRLKQVITVDLLEVEQHPNADKLLIATIYDGKDEHKVVTGASNIKKGQKLFWAPPGTELPTGQKIEKTVLRDVESMGMLCSASELLLEGKLEAEESKGGLLIAPFDAVSGKNYLETMGFDSPLLEFEITANRADCFSMTGIAREISVLTNEPLLLPEIKVNEDANTESQKEVSIEIEDTALCYRFVGQVLTNIKVEKSPLWLVQALQSIGLRSINNVVDVTNFVMMEMGQPLHAYDRDQLAGNKLIARLAKEGEKVITLDEKERNLTPDMIVIADAEKPVGIAGVMGGLLSEVTENTKTIVLEGAVFHGPSVRKTSRALGLRSDASSRFERGVDLDMANQAVLRAAQLLQEMGAGEIAKGYLDIGNQSKRTLPISFTAERINQFLGTDIPEERMIDILTSLGCTIEKKENDLWEAFAPSWRGDISIFQDLAEEIIRIYGYDNIPPTLPISASKVVQLPKLSQVERATTDLLAGLGFNQCVHFSFSCPEVVKKLNIDENSSLRQMIPVLNPIVDELSHMKTTLLGSLLETLQKNQSQKAIDLKLFEVARTFSPHHLPLNGELPTENLLLSVVATGAISRSSWNQKPLHADFYYMKGIAERVLKELKITNATFSSAQNPMLHPGRTAEIKKDGVSIGWIGEIHPLVQENFDLSQPTIYLEINLNAIEKDALSLNQYEIFGRFPSIYRDLAFVVSTEVTHKQMAQLIRNAGGDQLIRCDLFDVYQGANLPVGKRSLAYSLVFQNPDRTLEDHKVDGFIQAIVKSASQEYQAELRS